MCDVDRCHAISPGFSLLSDDEELIRVVREVAEDLQAEVVPVTGGTPCVIDPAIGIERLREQLISLTEPPPAAIIRAPSSAAVVLVALRCTRAVLIEPPQLDASQLRAFLTDTFGLFTGAREQREYPRALSSGVRIVEPGGLELLDLSPFGLRVRVHGDLALAPAQRLTLEVPYTGQVDTVLCQVVAGPGQQEPQEYRMRFAKISEPMQQEFFKIAKASLFCQTISETFCRCEQESVRGYRPTPHLPERLDILRGIVNGGAQLTFARLHNGRALLAEAVALDEDERQLCVRLSEPQALGVVGSFLRYASSVRFESYLFDGHLLRLGDGEATLSLPSDIFQTDRRSRERWAFGLATDLTAAVRGRRFPVVDLSPRGFSFFVAGDQGAADLAGRTVVEFYQDRALLQRDDVLLRHDRPTSGGHLVGAMFLPRREGGGGAVLDPLPSSVVQKDEVIVERISSACTAERVEFGSTDRPLVGLWAEVPGGPERTVVVVPPAWARTKEATTQLAQCLCATFRQQERHIAVFRFDYSNALGESFKDARYELPGKEMLGLTFTACVRDIREAVSYACARLGPDPVRLVLVGMSFSGPLCLRAAVHDQRVSMLIQLMGASDIQDLVRTSTGGLDYVARHCAGIRSGHQNVLGVVADPDRWVGDGLRADLVYLQDAQLDAALLDIPLLWICGGHDTFINIGRIRSILAAATCARQLVVVPAGHTPPRGAQARASFLPILRFLLPDIPLERVRVVLPRAEILDAQSAGEWRRAPKTRLPSPMQYWRDYMLGVTDNAMGFDILALTREYRQLMADQVRLLELPAGATLHDLGGGLGHVLEYLERLAEAPTLELVLYDLVPELLERVEERAATESKVAVRTRLWSAEDPAAAEALHGAGIVLMSMFLSCLTDPGGFLQRLWRQLPDGARIVASTILEDADLSAVYTGLLADIDTEEVSVPSGYSRETFVQAVRDYMNSAAWLLKLSEEGTFQLFSPEEFTTIFERAGFRVLHRVPSFGTPPRALVLLVERCP